MPLQQQVSTSFPAPSRTAAFRSGLTGRSLWPDAVAYREAIQEPAGALTDAELRTATVALDRQEMPLTYSGRFAVVFRLKTLRGENWAVRCFTSPPSDGEVIDRGDRYRAIAGHLSRMNGFFVPYRYIEDGIRVGSSFYPIVAMRWAQGRTLGRWVEDHLSDPDALRSLCGALSALLNATEAAGIAHGDWQHDNLLIADEGRSVTLVDYDGVYVPELAGLPSPEMGHPNYQHPARLPEHFGPGLDRFACLVIQTALLGLARDPGLWTRFSDGESMLFKQADLADPTHSPVFHAVRAVAEQHRDETLADSLARLEDACAAGPNSALLPAIAPSVITKRREAAVSAAERTDSAAPSDKWWLSPETVAVRPVAVTQQSFPPASVSATAATSSAIPADMRFLQAALSADALAQEKQHFCIWRLVAIASVIILPLLAFAGFSGKISGAWVLFMQLPNLINIGYATWPRKKVSVEITAEIKKMEKAISERRERITHMESQSATLNSAIRGAANVKAFVNQKLSQTVMDQAIAIPGITHDTLQYLKGHNIYTALDFRDHGGLIASVGKISPHRVAALKQWVSELEMKAAAEYGQLNTTRTSKTTEITRLEHEISGFEREREKLEREKEQLPDASFRTYWRRLIGLEPI